LIPSERGSTQWTYPSEEPAIVNALRLARGITYKYAAAGVNLDGGKAVIISEPKKASVDIVS
jgi:leucine dehydrogenase